MKDAFSQTSDNESKLKSEKLANPSYDNRKRRPYDYRRTTESMLSPPFEEAKHYSVCDEIFEFIFYKTQRLFLSLLVMYPDHLIDHHQIPYLQHHQHEATIIKNHHVLFTSTSIALDRMQKILVLKMNRKHRPTIIVSSKKNQIPHHKQYTIPIK